VTDGQSVLAQTSESWGLGAGPGAFLMVVLLGAALVLLLRSMRKQLRRIDFDDTGESDAERMHNARRPPSEGPDA
jgi:hypothetical protein